MRRVLGFSSVSAALGDPLLVKFPPRLPALRHLRSCAASGRVKTQTRPVWRISNVPSQLSVYQRFSVPFFKKKKREIFILFPFGLTPLCAIWLKLCMCISRVWSVNDVWKRKQKKHILKENMAFPHWVLSQAEDVTVKLSFFVSAMH